MSQRSQPVINTASQSLAVVNTTEFGVFKSNGQGLDFMSTKCISKNTMTQCTVLIDFQSGDASSGFYSRFLSTNAD